MNNYNTYNKLKNRIISLFVIITIFISQSNGQEQLGLRLENRSGINAISINPANSFLSPRKWDINIVSGGFFSDNDYGYLKSTNTLELIRNAKTLNIEYDSTKYNQMNYPPGTILMDFYEESKARYFTLSSNIAGPSFSVKIDKNNSLGFISALRLYGNIQKIPSELGFYSFYDKPYYQDFQISSFNSGLIYWHEYGINYVHKYKGFDNITLSGITLKYLDGKSALYFNNNKRFKLQQMPNDSIAAIDRLYIEYGYTNTDMKFNDLMYNHNGAGVSVDLGVTIVLGENIEDAKYRFGISLLDIGFIDFHNNSKQYSIEIDTFKAIDLSEVKDVKSVPQLDSINQKIFEEQFGFDENNNMTNRFTMLLPMALSIQFRYSLPYNININAVLIQRLISKGNSASRYNLFALTPVYERKWFSMTMPVVVYDWRDVRLGLSLRAAFFTIGSDNIFTLFTDRAQYTGTDFYAGLKLNPFPVKRRKNLNKNIKCFDF